MNGYEENDLTGSIAIIGMSGRFPGAKDMNEFWSNLYNGVESVKFFNRDELIKMGIDEHLIDNPRFVAADAILDGMDQFDASFFDYSAREAEIMDPQHRLFLESAWEVLESAGYSSDLYDGRIAVYAGANLSGYMIRNLYSNKGLVENIGSFKIMLANGQDFLATKVSYKMNLMGPSVNVNTLCSSSLVAVHYACQSLMNFDCDIALAGGVSFQVSRNEAFFYQEGGIGSSDGHCRAFDSKANGTVSGSGLAVVALKRLEDAIADGDYRHAVIKGTGINNDGSNKNSYTAPNVDGQAECIAEAIAVSGVNPETITYIDAHGTGTNLGDPIEMAALTKAYQSYTEKKQFCAIGSVKTNIGHLVNAGGLASVIKTVLAMKNRAIPPSLNFEEPNPKIDFVNSPFYVNTSLSKWETDGFPLRAGVSSFGIGGTNTHIIIEEAPAIEASEDSDRPWQLISLSAKTENVLENMTRNLAGYVSENPGSSLADIAFTLHVGRRNFNHRKIMLVRDMDDFAKEIEGNVFSRFQKTNEQSLIFMFPDVDSYYMNMGSELYRTEKMFKETVDNALKILEDQTGINIHNQMFKSRNELLTDQKLEDEYKEASVFIIEYALARLLMNWEINPEYLAGKGIGEWVAACISGVFSLEDALRLVSSKVDLLHQTIQRVSLKGPQLPFISSVTGDWITDEESKNPEYWVMQRNGSSFDVGLNKILQEKNRILMEVGPGNIISTRVYTLTGGDSDLAIITTMPAVEENESETKQLLLSVGKYWLFGGRINWNKMYENEKRHRIPLPTYPFERKSYWIDPWKSEQDSENSFSDGGEKLKKLPRPQIETPYVAPRNKTERIIEEICEDILGYERIGIDDDFFDLGGHSLLAVALITRLRKAFHKDLSLQSLFDNTTIAKIAQFFKEASDGKFEDSEYEEGQI
ncbi:MAG: beta-ketoacyl synthase N-terminal-like domain-containing protein [Bacillota bacterium]|nr:beta-ketoacyl synthase N-terminal-like domain-containing protein [Bacillota bacterium]